MAAPTRCDESPNVGAWPWLSRTLLTSTVVWWAVSLGATTLTTVSNDTFECVAWTNPDAERPAVAGLDKVTDVESKDCFWVEVEYRLSSRTELPVIGIFPKKINVIQNHTHTHTQRLYLYLNNQLTRAVLSVVADPAIVLGRSAFDCDLALA